MGTITKVNDILCSSLGYIDDKSKASISSFDDNSLCPGGSATPTPTVTPTPTPTPVCTPECCPKELCYDKRDPRNACSCIDTNLYYLHLPCGGDCFLSNADGIFFDDLCTTPADPGFYTDGTGQVYNWNGVDTLTYDSDC